MEGWWFFPSVQSTFALAPKLRAIKINKQKLDNKFHESIDLNYCCNQQKQAKEFTVFPSLLPSRQYIHEGGDIDWRTQSLLNYGDNKKVDTIKPPLCTDNLSFAPHLRRTIIILQLSRIIWGMSVISPNTILSHSASRVAILRQPDKDIRQEKRNPWKGSN